MKPEPIYRIPANAACRNPNNWSVPSSLCRTCIYLFLLEPFCKTVWKSKYTGGGIAECDGFELETKIDKSKPFVLY